MSAELTKVDSAIAGLSIDDKAPVKEEKEVKKHHHKRVRPKTEGVWNIKDLGKLKFIILPLGTIDNRQPSMC